MGQHLHLYAIEQSEESAVQAWCRCRADELFRLPQPGFETEAQCRIQRIMDARSPSHHIECGSKWCVSIWPRFIWHPQLVADRLIEQAKHDLEYAMLTIPALPYSGSDWLAHPVLEFLTLHHGRIVWGDNDGI